MFELKDFQKQAVEELSETFLDLWETGEQGIPLIFKAPTGAGKTMMMAEFLRCLDDDYQFSQDKAYLWISFSEDSYEQSKKKFWQYSNKGTDMHLKDLANLNEGKLYKNNVFFINWQKIKGTSKESRKLRRSTEHTDGDLGLFDEYIKNTKKEKRDLILIIDEAHTQANTELADEVIQLISPRIILKVTATPKNIPNAEEINDKKAGFVGALESEVIASGLIKEKLIIQKEEEIKEIQKKEIQKEKSKLNEDEIMLKLAFQRRLELKKHYEELDLEINPLVLIQLPSDENEIEEIEGNKKEMVLSYLMENKKVQKEKIAIWLSNEKKNLKGIEENNSQVDFMLFKVAPATGWDCPRADVLVMFREIENPSFHTQILGRVKRMPEGYHYTKAELNNAYIYTNYNKSHLQEIEGNDPNKPPVYFTKLKESIEQIKLQSVVHHRTDFNTLTPPPLWQTTLIETFHQYFETSDGILKQGENQEKVGEKINLSQTEVSNKIIVDAEIESYDDFLPRLKENAKDYQYNLSQQDIEKLYNLLCFRELKKQEKEEAKYNPSRSWSPLKSALNVYFGDRLGLEKEDYYKILINEFLKENNNSELKKAIKQALIDFRKKYNLEIGERKKIEEIQVFIPEKEKCFTNDFEEVRGEKNVYEKFYLKREYLGRENEISFINFLKSQEIDWWHKQEDSGRNQFAVRYFSKEENKHRLFYPDWILKKVDKLYILDTKAGNTLNSPDTKYKAEALQKWISKNQRKKKQCDFKIIGGIVKFEHPSWKINSQKKYDFSESSDWEDLDFS